MSTITRSLFCRVQKLSEHGIIQKLYSDQFLVSAAQCERASQTLTSFGVRNTALIFMMLSLGIIISITLLLGEKYTKNRIHRKRSLPLRVQTTRKLHLFNNWIGDLEKKTYKDEVEQVVATNTNVKEIRKTTSLKPLPNKNN